MRIKLLILFIVSMVTLKAQTDTSMLIEYSYGYKFKDGLYINFAQFLENNPTRFNFITIDTDQTSQDIIENLEQSKTINFFNEFGIETSININEIWGCCVNGKPHVMWKNEFRLIPYIGSISHFVANITVYYESMHDPFYDPYYYYSSVPSRQHSNELVQMIIDMKTGKILEFNTDNISKVLARDSSLFKEFSELSKRKKRKLLFSFIRRYNENHPLYLPKNTD
ncbi:MAG TPA: hypothetical protein PLO05_10660 [Bacteroidales bacterium]|nr:hypothetical protein [Bacteroidales bacterium]HXK82608.1 hypothetical protein [Bacteroidales bacterium]